MEKNAPTYARMSRALLTFAVLAAAALVIAVVQGVISERDNEIENARRRSQNLSRLLEEHARQSLRRVEWVLSEAARDGASGGLTAWATNLMRNVESDGLVRALIWLDDKGDGILINRDGSIRLSAQGGRDFFAAHRSGSSAPLSLGAPVTDLMPGSRLLPMSKRLSRDNGDFAGVLVALIEPRHMQSVYDAIDTGKSGGVALFLRSGWVAVRAPHVEAMMAKRWDQTPMFQQHLPYARVGTVRQVVVADGVDRIYSYRELEDYPVVVYFGLSVDDVLAPWRGRAAVSLGLLGLALAAVAAGVWSLLRRLREHAADAGALAAQAELRRVTLHSIADAVITTDAQGIVEFMNPAAERLCGWSHAQAAGRPVARVFCVFDESSGEAIEHPVTRCLSDRTATTAGSTALLASRDGRQVIVHDQVSSLRDADGVLKGVVLVFRDVTLERRRAAELAHRASHDSLTGLFNRAEFELRLDRLLQRADDRDGEHALMYIDLDRFKEVNDTAGHLAGDRLLCRVATMLQHSVRARDTVARLGGDEFVVLLEKCPLERARELAQEICDRVQTIDFVHGGRTFQIGASIGLVKLVPSSGDSASAMQDADAACYAAKAEGRNRVHFGAPLALQAR